MQTVELLHYFLKKTPKTYKATLWLGVYSLSLDDQNIKEIQNIKEFDLAILKQIIDQMRAQLASVK